MNAFRKFALFAFLLMIVAALVFPGAAYAGEDQAIQNDQPNSRQLHDQFVFGDSYTLNNGETLVGDLFILGGTVTLEPGSLVKGSVVLVGGTLTVQGTIEKDLVAVGGTPTLDDSAHIMGNAVTVGSQLNGATGGVDGQVISNVGSVFSVQVFDGRVPTLGVSRVPVLWGFLGLSFSVFFMTALAIGTELLLPRQTEQTAKVLVSQPVAAGGMGCLTVIVAPIILIALAITIILSPVSLLGAALLVILVLFGWVAIGLELGNRIAQALNQDWHPAVSAGAGTFILTLVTLGLSRVILCVGWMIPFLVSMVALGAVVLVFFGAGKIAPSTPVPVSATPASIAVESAPPTVPPQAPIPSDSEPNPPDTGPSNDEEIPPAI